MKARILEALVACLLVALIGAAWADDAVEARVTLKNHAFVPADLSVPAGQKIRLMVVNEDATAAEFESYELSREKIVPAHGQVTVYLDPLDAGVYPLFDDFRRDTVTGKIVAK